jgi:hypothetical protein
LPDVSATLITDSAGVLNIGSGQIYKDTSGNVGIGTSSPGTKLQVNSSTTTASNNVAWDTTGSTLNLAFTGTSATDAGSSISFNDQGTTGLAAIKGAREATSGNGYLSFLTRNGSGGQYATERARINSSGQWLFNCTGQTGDAPNTAGGRINETNGNEKVRVAIDSQVAFQFYSPSGGTAGPVGSVTVNASSTSYVTSSDYRLKENIAPMTGALTKVAALKPVTYSWKNTGEADEGFIAHELQEVCPNAVVGEKDAVDAEGNPQYQGIDTSFLVATLTAAIQEQQAIITALTARVEALEGTQP